MKVYQTKEIRNITVIGNSGAGKTTLVESMLFEGGVISRRGDVKTKTTASDYNLVEQEYGNSVHATVLYTEFEGCKINIIDTPGMDDFVGGVIPALSVAATGLLLFNAVNGVEVGTEIANRNAEKFHKPLMFVINHLDHEHKTIDGYVERLEGEVKAQPIVSTWPQSYALFSHGLLSHMKREEEELFPESERVLGISRLVELSDEIERHRSEAPKVRMHTRV